MPQLKNEGSLQVTIINIQDKSSPYTKSVILYILTYITSRLVDFY